VTSWKLPLLVAAIAVPIALAFLAAGPALGVAVGALAVVAIVFFAVRQRPRDAIETAGGDADVRRVLVVVGEPLEDPAAVEDQLGSFPASEVILVSAGGDKAASAAAEELRTRLRTDFRWIVTGPAAR